MEISVFFIHPQKGWSGGISVTINDQLSFTGLVDLREMGVSFLCGVRYHDGNGQHGFPQGSLASFQSENKQISLTVITVPLIWVNGVGVPSPRRCPIQGVLYSDACDGF